jgi:hypothetical protein
MEKSAKRLSSIFSLGSNSTIPETSVASSHTSSSRHPSKASRGASPTRSPARLPYLSTDIRGSTSTPNLRNGHSPTHQSPFLTPTLDPGRSSTPDDARLFQPLDTLKPLPNRIDSPGTSRPSSRASSRGGSRPASPIKFRPWTPNQEQRQLSKRRSWLPGRSSRPESQDAGAMGIPQAWILTAAPQEKPAYDLLPLANFQKVNSLTRFCDDSG